MKALVKFDRGPGFMEVRDIPVPEIGAGDVLIKVRACGVDRGGDLYVWKSVPGMWHGVPVVVGAENCGEVAAVGNNVEHLKVGDRVVCEVIVGSCGECQLCREGNYLFCKGKTDIGRTIDGAFAEFFRAPARYVHKIPDAVSWKAAVLTEMAAVAARCMLETVTIRPSMNVAVIGPGPIGLLCAQMARIAGARRVVLLGLSGDQKRFDLARQMNIEETAVVDRPDFETYVSEEFPDLFDLVVEASGGTEGANLALKLAAPLGTVAAVGTPVGKKLAVDWALIAIKQLTIQGTYAHTWSTWELVLSLMASGKLVVEPMYSGSFPLEEWEKAFTTSETSMDALKLAICPHEPL